MRASAGLAQQPVPTQGTPVPIMQRLGELEGEWRGTSWFAGPTGRVRTDSWEKVERRMGGLVVLVHGRHTSLEQADSGRVVHEAFGMLYYDGTVKELKFVPVRFDGGVIETWVKETEKGLDWGFDLPGGAGKIRYTFDISQPDVWNELGEYSRDGTTWLPVIGLNLEKVK